MDALNPRHLLARGLGVPPGAGSRCAVCGDSPFDPGPRGARGCFGSTFTDWDALTLPTESAVCLGCERLLSGRPGDDPPPVRTRSVLFDGEQTVILSREAWWDLLRTPNQLLPGVVLSWATSGKRHHWLHAGISGSTRWEVGTDHGTARWDPDPRLAPTIAALLALGARKGEILSGHYPAPRITPALLDLDTGIAPLRGSLILDLAIWAAPIEDRDESPAPEPLMIDPVDAAAADLVADIAWAADVRVNDGLRFWAANGFLVRRLRRFSHADLPTLVSRLMSECGVGAEGARRVVATLQAADANHERALLDAIRSRPDLITALAFDRVQRIRDDRRTKTTPQPQE